MQSVWRDWGSRFLRIDTRHELTGAGAAPATDTNERNTTTANTANRFILEGLRERAPWRTLQLPQETRSARWLLLSDFEAKGKREKAKGKAPAARHRL